MRAASKTGVVTVPRSAWVFADCTDETLSRHAGSDTPVSQGRLRPGAGVRARLHGEESPRPRRRPRRDARHRRRSSAMRPHDADGHAEPGGRRRSTTSSRIGDSQSGNFIKTFIHLGFNEDDSPAASSGTARFRGSRRARRRWTSGSRCPAAPRPSTSRAAKACSGGAATTTRSAAGRKPACSIAARPRTRVRRSSRRSARRSSGACACRPDLIGTDATSGPPAPRQRPALLLSGHDARGGRGGFQLEAGPSQGGCACPQSQPGSRHDAGADRATWSTG